MYAESIRELLKGGRMQNSLIGADCILVIAPHADDAELGAGASISRWVEEGKEVHIANLSDTSNLNGEAYGAELRLEAKAASTSLGVPEGSVLFADFPLRNFDSKRQEILDYLVTLRRNLSPQLVIGPSAGDVHQDHGVVAREVQRAFKGATVLGFDTYWNMTIQRPEFVFEVSEKNLQAKLDALREYKSQSTRPYMHQEVIRGQARMRGLPNGFQFAESFTLTHAVSPLGE